MARLAIFSDVHGNYQGLLETLADAESRGATEFICLGDVAERCDEGGAPCIDLLQKRAILTVRGNHDENELDCLTPEENRWLRQLPFTHTRGDLLFIHISPDLRDQGRGIDSEVRAAIAFEDNPDFRIAFVGHTHIPALFREVRGMGLSAHLPEWSYGAPVPLEKTERYIVAVGAVGYPRDGMARLRYVIFDEETSAVEFIRIKGTLLPFY